MRKQVSDERYHGNGSCPIIIIKDREIQIQTSGCNNSNPFICVKTPVNLTEGLLANRKTVKYDADCGMMWEKRSGTYLCYQFRETKMSWFHALEHCAYNNGSLASITSSEEQTYIEGKISELDFLQFWIGASDRQEMYNFQWEDESPFLFSKWDEAFSSQVTPYPATSTELLPSGRFYSCAQGWLNHDDHCYQIITKEEQFSSGFSNCKAQNSTMASIHSKEENGFIWSHLSQDKIYWIGTVLESKDSHDVWLDSTTVNYTNWAYFLPNSKYQYQLRTLFVQIQQQFQLYYSSSKTDQQEVLINNDLGLKKDKRNNCEKRTEKKNPKRPCPFCGIFQSKLSRHLRLIHKNETEVFTALNLPASDRNRIFSNLRKQGILKSKISDKLAQKPDNNILQERTKIKDECTLCRECGGFYSKKTIHKHRRKCAENEYSCSLKLNFATTVASISASFDSQVVSKLSTDVVGNYIRSDLHILMFALEKSLQELSEDEAGELKAGPKLTASFIIKNFANFLSGLYITKDDTNKFKETERFLKLLQFRWSDINYAAEKKIRLSKSEKLRRPNELPDEDDVLRLRDFTFTEIETLVQDQSTKYSFNDFVKLRNLILCRLTLFNARRGGEPARLLLKEYWEGKSDAWIDNQRLDHIRDPLDRELMNTYKITYQAGKGHKKLVPILIPKNLIPAIDLLIHKRKEFGIPEDKTFLFPTAKSETYVQGWSAVKYCVDSIADKLKKPHLLIADKFSHRASTLYAQLDVPIERRQYFYSHMGHSEDINKHVYQAPLATQQIIHVGGFLHKLDTGSLLVPQASTTEIANDELSKNTLAATEMTNSELENGHLMFDINKSHTNRFDAISGSPVQKYSQEKRNGKEKKANIISQYPGWWASC
ncbi:hypothetical protein Btru_047258 [Bulinus truncatus]|nr:hypothetical protein Btru_047258 [Bulinus truncatus]